MEGKRNQIRHLLFPASKAASNSVCTEQKQQIMINLENKSHVIPYHALSFPALPCPVPSV